MDSATIDENDQRPDKPRGVSKARLADLDLKPAINIYYRTHRNEPYHELVRNFPKQAATLFSNKIFKSMRNDDTEARPSFYTIMEGDKDALKLIFQWILDCANQKNIIKFPDIPEPAHNPFQPTLNVLVAADVLEVPAGSLGFFVEKRLYFIARKHLMSFDQVHEWYDPESEPYKMGLKMVACMSVFNAWWDARLDEQDTPDMMEKLADLRDLLPELDEDLHAASEEKKVAIERSRLEKKLKREQEQHGGQAAYDPNSTCEPADYNHNGFNSNNADIGSVWDTEPAVVNSANDWMQENTTADGGTMEWKKPVQSAANAQPGWSEATSGGNDWADDAIEHAQHFVPVSGPSGGW